jgi:amino acid transporter
MSSPVILSNPDPEKAPGTEPSLQRKITWTGAFWVSSGVPALVLFSIGAVAAAVGKPAWLVWTVSILFGFLQAFTYAEVAGLFPGKSGGASIYGAVAWVRYSKILAPVSVWCNWFAWSPVLAIGSGLTAGYVLLALFPADSPVHTWKVVLLDLGMLKDGLTIRLNATFLVGAAVMLLVFAVQHGGILRSAKATMLLGIVALVPLLVIGMVPILTGDLPAASFLPLVPLARDSADNVIDGTWDRAGWTLFMGGLFIAAWSTYAFETSVCYTRELKNPRVDTFKAIFYSGLLCLAAFTLIPLAFQARLGLDGMLAKDIADGSGVGNAMSQFLGGGALVRYVLLLLLLLALLLATMTAMAGSSRTLYQASVDGWLPRYLSHVNGHGAPMAAMWTDLGFNLCLLALSDYVFVLAASNVGYIIFCFLNLNAGWIHRLDRPSWERPWKAPTWLLATGTVLAFVNALILGMGANVWGSGTLLAGLVFVALIVPVFLYRHYVQDKGKFPKTMVEDMHLGTEEGITTRAGIWPYLAIVAGIAVVCLGILLAA